MIIKSLSRKAGGTNQLFKYLFRYMLNEEKNKALQEENEETKKQPQFVLRHNIRARSVPGYIKEFERNEELRIHKRKDNVQVYHSILSFSNKDKEYITETVLRDMAKRYIELRGKENLYVITAHYDKDHVHLHCAMSGTKLTGLSSRISRNEFANIKIALDAYQKEKYPQLVHSLPRHGKAKQIEAREDLKNIKRNERTVDKNVLLKVLDETFSQSASRELFLDSLKTLGHMPYYRAGILTGVKYSGDRKFKLNRLGFDEKKLVELDTKAKEEKGLQELQEIRNGKQKEPRQQTLPLELRLKNLSSLNQQKELQELANFNEDIQLQELRDIRENQGKGMDRNDSHEDTCRDRVDDTDRYYEEGERKDKSDDDEIEDDKNTESEMASDDSDDEQAQ